MEEGWKYFCGFGFACFILLYKLYKLKTKMNTLTVQIFYNLQNHPTSTQRKGFVKVVRGRELFVGLSILFVYVAL